MTSAPRIAVMDRNPGNALSHLNRPPIKVAVVNAAERGSPRHAWGEQLGQHTADLGVLDSNAAFVLAVNDSFTELRTREEEQGHGVIADVPIRWCRGPAMVTRRQPLGRAMGKRTTHVIDCTAGLCADAMRLALMGLRVTAIERSPIIWALAADALQRASAPNQPSAMQRAAGRVDLHLADAQAMLGGRALDPAAAIYMDPMYPHKRKASALASKAIRRVRQVVGDDDDAAKLLATAQAAGFRRIVVKRPKHAPPLAEPTDAVIAGKLARYDIYLNAR